MKKGDKVAVSSAFYHGFDDGEVVEFTGEYFLDQPTFINEKGVVQTVREKDFKALPVDEPFDEELDDLIGSLSSYTVPTEHRPRNTESFTLTITEEALKDDIPFIIDAYYTNSLSLRDVGHLLGVDEKTIRRRMRKHNVPTRSVSQALRAKYSL